MWDDFRAALRLFLMNFSPRVFLVVSDQEHRDLFVQFAGLDERYDPEQITAQLASRRNGEHISLEQVALLEQWGFNESPEKYGSLWQRDLPWPTLSAAIAETVNACILTLRDIGGVPDPGRLQYRAWRDPEPVDPLRSLSELDPGERSVSFPSLGIMQDPSDPSSW